MLRIRVRLPLADEGEFLDGLTSVGVQRVPQLVKRVPPDDESEFVHFVVTRITAPQLEMLLENRTTRWHYTSSPIDEDSAQLMNDIHQYVNAAR